MEQKKYLSRPRKKRLLAGGATAKNGRKQQKHTGSIIDLCTPLHEHSPLIEERVTPYEYPQIWKIRLGNTRQLGKTP